MQIAYLGVHVAERVLLELLDGHGLVGGLFRLLLHNLLLTTIVLFGVALSKAGGGKALVLVLTLGLPHDRVSKREAEQVKVGHVANWRDVHILFKIYFLFLAIRLT